MMKKKRTLLTIDQDLSLKVTMKSMMLILMKVSFSKLKIMTKKLKKKRLRLWM